MKLYSKRLVSVLIIFVLMFSLCTATIFATGTYGTVNGNVVNTGNTAGNIGVSNIQLDVYALVSVYTDSNQTDFDKIFAFSVYTDAEGAYTFTKPSANCIVEINENSVADSYGVLTGIDIIGADDTTSELSISPLATYEVDLADNSLQFYNAEDKKLTVKENLDSSALGNVQLRDTEESVSLLSDTDLAPVGTPPEYSSGATYTNGFFTIHYESGTLTDSELYEVYLQLNHTKTSLCSVYQYRAPLLYSGNSTYHVYLVEDLVGRSGYCQGYGLSQTETFIGVEVEDDIDNGVKATLSHEFMHAVISAYNTPGGYDILTLNEAVSEMAGFTLSSYWYPDWINQYQNSPELSMFDTGSHYSSLYGQRDYGAVLFPLYLANKFSGYTTIREIYEDMEVSRNIYTSIDNVLSEKHDTSFIEAYIDFRVCNYDVQSNYNLEDEYDLTLTGVQNSPKKTAITEDAVTYTTPKLSTMYFEFEADTEDFYTFCFALQGETGKSEVNLTGIYTSPDGDVNIITYPFTSSLKMPNVDMEEGSTICFLMSNINVTSTDIQFYVCM